MLNNPYPKIIALAAIVFYKRFISPYKGFSCAYRAHTGRSSCSSIGYRAIRRYGLLKGYGVLKERTYRCGVAHRRFSSPIYRGPFASQRGDCDPGCVIPGDGCDLPDGKICSNALDALNICYCDGCDWPDRKSKQRKRKDEKSVHLPPKR